MGDVKGDTRSLDYGSFGVRCSDLRLVGESSGL